MSMKIRCLLQICAVTMSVACTRQYDYTAPKHLPPLILWAWEAPQILNSINSTTTGVAVLILTADIINSKVHYYPRQQPLIVPPNTYLIAVVHIGKPFMPKQVLNPELAKYLAKRIKNEYQKHQYKELQIDFDVLSSEHKFYKELLVQLRHELGSNLVISITALASWCTSDKWITKESLPINYVVPMFFSLGNNAQARNSFIMGFNPNKLAKYCQGTIGLSTDEKWNVPIYDSTATFVYHTGSWTSAALQKAYELQNQHRDIINY